MEGNSGRSSSGGSGGGGGGGGGIRDFLVNTDTCIIIQTANPTQMKIPIHDKRTLDESQITHQVMYKRKEGITFSGSSR